MRAWNLRECRCPRCGSRDLSRKLRRGVFQRWILSLANVRPYKCNRCKLRLYAHYERPALRTRKLT